MKKEFFIGGCFSLLPVLMPHANAYDLLAPNVFGPVPTLSEYAPSFDVPKASEYIPDRFDVPTPDEYIGRYGDSSTSSSNRNSFGDVPKSSSYIPDPFDVPKVSEFWGRNSQGTHATKSWSFKPYRSSGSSGRRFTFKRIGPLGG